MTIEELFGTLQQSVVSTWRKHLRTAKYSKHMALNDFYEEMPEKVDALIEAWMGVNGRKIKSYDNILQSKNMNTLSYLKDLRKVVKDGYSLMNGEAELEALLDDIVELIDSTLYKVKELSESNKVDLKDFLIESLNIITESKINFNKSKYWPDNWQLSDIFNDYYTNYNALKDVDWEDYFDEDFVKKTGNKEFVKFFDTLFKGVDFMHLSDLGNVGEGGFSEDYIRDKAGIGEDQSGLAIHADGDNKTWTIIGLKDELNKLPKATQDAWKSILDIYEKNGQYIIEYF